MLTLVVVPVAYLLFDRITTSRAMKWIVRKFFGIDPNLPAESLDTPWATDLHGSPHLASQLSPDLSARSDADDPVAGGLVIPNIVKPGHRE